MSKLSCIIITYNEEENIRRCLEALCWCDEIVIADSGSTDETLKICNEFGCKIFNKEFNGFGEFKQFAVSKVSNDWVLSIDSDEVVTEELKNEIISELGNDNIEPAGFYIPRSLFFLGKRFKYGKESKEYYLRLFNKNFGSFTQDRVHEKVLVEGKTVHLYSPMLHYSYNSLHQYFEKFNKYTTQAAEQLFEKGKKRSLFLTIIGFPLYFFKNYILNRNFLNGWQGFLWALFSSWYPVVKYAKLWALWNKNNRSH
jgi:glycosyltransferase involved in cell wall biosynthesis